jgi:uncharacterized lipoprotein YddW (UPF0748 family)
MRRPPVRLLAIGTAALIAVTAIGVGLLRAAGYQPPVAGPAGAPGFTADAVAGSCAGVRLAATRELRGMWLTTVNNIDFPSRPGLSEAAVKAEYLGWLDLAVAQHHNAIFVHVRPSGDAFWPSEYAPWSEFLTGKRDGKSPGWDPMAFMVAAAHERNLDFHAWFNPYRGSQPAPFGPGADFAKLAPNHPLRQHRDWAIAYPTGRTARLYFDPGNPAARRYVEDAMLEAVTKYDIDGVHFDDFFYPYPEAGQDFPDGASFAKRTDKAQGRADWRRGNVDTLVREMNQRIKAAKPWVQFGISPFGIWRNASTDRAGSASNGLQSYDAIYADTRTWVTQQWVDYIVPQLYWAIGFAKADYAKLLPWWSNLVRGTRVRLYIGQADYRIGEKGAWSDPSLLDRQLTLNHRYAVSGSVHFSAKQIKANRLGAVARYRDHHYAGPALLPVMPQLPAAPPAPPRLVSARRAPSGAVEFDWRAAAGAATVGWALYRLDGPAAGLVATGRATARVVDPAPPKGAATYCLAGLDRSANEGAPSAAYAVSP